MKIIEGIVICWLDKSFIGITTQSLEVARVAQTDIWWSMESVRHSKIVDEAEEIIIWNRIVVCSNHTPGIKFNQI